MRIFVTGATGFIGYAVASELARAGHSVFGLARNPEKAKRLAAAEVFPVIGDMETPASFAASASEAQVIVHCAAEYSPRMMELDRNTVLALLADAGTSGRPRRFIYTSGCWVYGNSGSETVDEASPLHPPAMVALRAETERIVLERNSGLVRTIVVRPGCVYGGAGSLTASWFETAEKEGAARIVGDGTFRWTMVHVSDLAVAYRLVAESDLGGEVFNITDRSRFTVVECARTASKAVNGTENVVITPVEDAMQQIGPMAECLAFDQHVDASKAVRLLGWNPRHGGFVDGVTRYYQSWKALRG